MENEKNYFSMSARQAMAAFGTGSDGLTDEQITQNRERYGANHLQEVKKQGIFMIFLSQFKDLLVIILIIAALISMATGQLSSTIVIFAVLILNAILGTVQYVRAEKSLESLKKLSSPEAKVIRGGKITVIDAADLVCGDLVTLEAGDIIPGDGRIIRCHSLKCNESSLTGESENAEKTSRTIDEEKLALGDRKNMIFSGSLVTYGRAEAVITAVGTETELGKIAGMMDQTAERKTPLQITMDNFSKKLSVIILLICVVIFFLSIYRNMTFVNALLFAVALAVAAIPEALSSIITISLAIGTSRMAEENAIVKDLNAVEGLGCVSVICSDKTGTLTQNKMTVQEEYPEEGCREEMILASILCNDTKFADGELIGDPTETAFYDYYIQTKGRDALNDLLTSYPRLSEVPFDSNRKLMSTLHHVNGRYVMFTKGALDVILARSTGLTENDKEEIRDRNAQLSGNGLRVLGFAMKYIDDKHNPNENKENHTTGTSEQADPAPHTSEQASKTSPVPGGKIRLTTNDEYGLTYIGLMAEMDPPREESFKAVEDCINAGIKPVMITGDHKVTASAIAKKIGIMKPDDLAFTGTEIDEMTDEELHDYLEHISVYARVSPENKIRIVQAWQDRDQIVAMTGDGVNDGPALKSADVGVAMGITGTEVAKDSASMILADDNFATIIKAVLNGRNIYTNIKNAIKYLLSGNAAAIMVVLFASLAGLSVPFTAVQLLFINLITDSLPALAISMEPSNPELIKDKPRPRDESVLNKPTLTNILATGILIALATAAAFLIGLGKIEFITALKTNVTYGPICASTMAFATLCLARLWHGFNCRGRECIFRLGLFSNMFSIGAFVLGAILLHCILLLPFFHNAFGVAQINGSMLGIVWALAFLPTLIIQVVKAVRGARRNSKEAAGEVFR